MTTSALIETVYSLGGSLMLDGGRIHYQLPESAGWLVGELRQHRDEVLALLRGQSVANHVAAIERWLGSECVQCKNCASNPRILYREFCRRAGGDQPKYESFVGALADLGCSLDATGMVSGLCLAIDFIAFCQYDREKGNRKQ